MHPKVDSPVEIRSVPTAASLNGHTGASPDNERPRFNSRFLFTAITLVAVWLSLLPVCSFASRIVTAIYALTFLFGCWQTRRAVLCLLPAIYVPYLWLLIPYLKTDEFALPGLTHVAHLPGLPMSLLLAPLTESWEQAVQSLATLGGFFSVTMLARPSKTHAFLSTLLVFCISAVNSFITFWTVLSD